MYNRILLLLILFLSCYGTKALANGDSSIATTPHLLDFKFLEKDTTNIDTQFTFCFVFYRDTLVHIDSISYWADSVHTLLSSTIDTGTYGKGTDTFCLTLSIDTGKLSIYLNTINVTFYTSQGTQRLRGYYYAEPWNQFTFYNRSTVSHKAWLCPTQGPSANRKYIHKDSLPANPDSTLPYKPISIDNLG
ncbi:MAG: hypothetical protein KDC92_15520, partial [Bacteroidetes bacterium]|nr:hypothetical protein [Bacteroidota bacterium]